MGTHFQTHTSDMSASLSCSSVAQSVALSESMWQKTSNDGLSGNLDSTNTDVGPDIVGLLTQLFSKGKYELVVEIAEELVNRHPQSFFLHNILGESFAFLGENLKAVAHFKKILQLEPSENEVRLREAAQLDRHSREHGSLVRRCLVAQAVIPRSRTR